MAARYTGKHVVCDNNDAVYLLPPSRLVVVRKRAEFTPHMSWRVGARSHARCSRRAGRRRRLERIRDGRSSPCSRYNERGPAGAPPLHGHIPATATTTAMGLQERATISTGHPRCTARRVFAYLFGGKSVLLSTTAPSVSGQEARHTPLSRWAASALRQAGGGERRGEKERRKGEERRGEKEKRGCWITVQKALPLYVVR